MSEAAHHEIQRLHPMKCRFERTGGGLLVEPDDPVSLADGLQQVWQNKDLARRLSEAGRAGVESHYLVSHMAKRTFEAFSGTLLAAQVNS